MDLTSKIVVEQERGVFIEATVGDLLALPMDNVLPKFGFESLQAGTFEFRIGEVEVKTVDMRKSKTDETKVPKTVIVIPFEVIGVRKLKDNATDPNDLIGKKHNEQCIISALDDGLGKVQAILLGAGLTGKGTLQSLLPQLTNKDVVAVVGVRKDKDDPSKEYSNLDLKSLAPLGASASPLGTAAGASIAGQVQQPAANAAPAGTGMKLGLK